MNINSRFEKKLVTSAGLNINDFKGENPININLKRISFYLNNLWLFKILNFLHLTIAIRLEVTNCNLALKRRTASFNTLLEQVAEQIKAKKAVTTEYDELIILFTAEIEKYSKINSQIESFLELKQHKLFGDFETTNKLTLEILQSCYGFLRLLKKKRNTNSIETSQLAKDTAAYSLNALRTVVNGH